MKKVVIFAFLCSTLMQVDSFQHGEKSPSNVDYGNESSNYKVGSPSSSSENLGKSRFSHSENDDKLLESSLSYVEPDNTNHTCREKLEWFKNTTLKTISLYHQHTKKLKELHIKPEVMKHLEVKHAEFRILIIALMGRNEEDTNELSGLSDAADRLAFCREHIEWYMVTYEKLTKTVNEMYGNEVRNQIDSNDTLLKVVYYLFIVSKRENAFKNMEYLTKELTKPSESGEETKNNHEMNEHGKVEPEREINADYDDTALDHHDQMEDELSRALHELTDDSNIIDAESRAEQRIREQNIQHIEAREHEAKIPPRE